MKRIVLFISLAVALLTLSVACHKDEPVKNPGTGDGDKHFSQTTLDYCYFKPGSWWVYVDSASQVRDSVYVTYSTLNNDTVTEQDNLGYTGIFERFQVNMEATYLDFKQEQYSHMAYFRYSPPGLELAKYGRYHVGYASGEEVLFVTKFQNGYTGGDIPGLYTSLGFYDSLKIGNSWYKNVAPFYNDENEAEYLSKTYMYFAKNIGLIQKEIIDSLQKWQLVSYHIEQ
jgi:hypothetical protein